MTEHVRVAIIGAGPSGLTAAAALAGTAGGEVRVIEREATAGGIPRHSDHLGYGVRDLHRFVSGPEYARRLDRSAREAGAVVETGAMVTGWAGERRFEVTSPRGRRVIEADAVVLATGARERPRSARLIPGDRAAGVLTTGQLQNLVHLRHATVGERAVIVGAELVSWSAAMTLRQAGCRVVLMTTVYEKSESYAAFRIAGRFGLRVPVAPRTRIVQINGRPRVESVELEDLDTGARRVVLCDTVVTTGDWIPDNELSRSAGLMLDTSTRGPEVDTELRTTAAGVFAIGNLVHPVDTADVAALDGRHVAASVLEWLSEPKPVERGVHLVADAPFRWISPQVVSPGRSPARGKLLLWADVFVKSPVVTASQDGVVFARRRLPWPCAPGRVFRIPASLVSGLDENGGPVHIGLAT